MKVYIAGKITGDPGYRDKFAAAEIQLGWQGNTVLNPAELPEGMTPADYMRICLAMIDVADSVVFLPNAKDSAGARLERAYCEYIGKEMEFWSDLRVRAMSVTSRSAANCRVSMTGTARRRRYGNGSKHMKIRDYHRRRAQRLGK